MADKVYTEPTNADRAEWAFKAVKTFADVVGGETEGEDLQVTIQDLLSDLMHLCEARGFDFEDLAERAVRHFFEERAEEREAKAASRGELAQILITDKPMPGFRNFVCPSCKDDEFIQYLYTTDNQNQLNQTWVYIYNKTVDGVMQLVESGETFGDLLYGDVESRSPIICKNCRAELQAPEEYEIQEDF